MSETSTSKNSVKPMDNSGTLDAKPPDSQEETGSDVALLYSWAKVENAQYRDFSRRRTYTSVRGDKAVVKIEDPAIKNGGDGDRKANASTLAGVDSSLAAVAGRPYPAQLERESTQAAADAPIWSGHLDTRVQTANPPALENRMPPYGFREAARSVRSPHLAIYSVAVGVGKTTICANLGKVLCNLGEQPLLVDATGQGRLAYYFGATNPATGLRKFQAPGPNASFIQVMAGNQITSEWLQGDVKHLMATSQRTIIDVAQASEPVLRAILGLCSIVIIPLLPDFDSIATILSIEKLLHTQATGLNPPAVYYLFNQFDEHRVIDQRAREFVEQHCGHRLLPIALRRDQELAEHVGTALPGLAEQAPGAELSHDYLDLALWLRWIAPPSPAALIAGRWNEQ